MTLGLVLLEFDSHFLLLLKLVLSLQFGGSNGVNFIQIASLVAIELAGN